MQAYEFSSIINNDGVVHIPKQYLEKISSPVKIILLSEDGVQNNRKKKFSAIKLKTKGFQFNREEANER
ncbi:MAG: hypothetical protein LBI28_06080 [Treponema sp.]|jgi:hypothetical protein|nr:hypothetical protein [Treponema sp.]